MKIFFDGGLRPAGMELAVVIAGQAYIERDLGPGTSMAAEWRALLAAISLAKERALADRSCSATPPRSSRKRKARSAAHPHTPPISPPSRRSPNPSPASASATSSAPKTSPASPSPANAGDGDEVLDSESGAVIRYAGAVW